MSVTSIQALYVPPKCPTCRTTPDMQDTGFLSLSLETDRQLPNGFHSPFSLHSATTAMMAPTWKPGKSSRSGTSTCHTSSNQTGLQQLNRQLLLPGMNQLTARNHLNLLCVQGTANPQQRGTAQRLRPWVLRTESVTVLTNTPLGVQHRITTSLPLQPLAVQSCSLICTTAYTVSCYWRGQGNPRAQTTTAEAFTEL